MIHARFVFGVLAGVLVWIAAGMTVAVAQDATGESQPRIDDRRLGEEEQILQRREWFFSTRRAGATSDSDLWSLRRAAVEETRQALAAQQLRRSLGFTSQPNFWVAKGPSPSTFGGWAFGNVSGRIQTIAADWSGGALYVGGGSGGVWKSTNDGLSWTSIFDSAGTTAVGAITIDPNDPNVIWVGTGDNIVGCESYFGIGLLRSPDGGQTWESRNGTGNNTLEELASFANVLVDPRDSNHLVVGGRYRGCASGNGQDGGLYISNDGGINWTNRIANTQIYEIVQDLSVLDVFWAATGQGVYKSVDNGVTWTLQTNSGLPSGSPGRTEIAIAPSDSNTIYALFSGGPSFWRTTDGGATWTQMSSGSNACDGQCWYNMVVRVHRTNPDIVYRGTVHFFKSLDGGATWADLSNSWGASQTVHQDMHSLLMHPTQPDQLYVGGDGGIWKTEDGGSTFANLNGNLNVTQFYAIGVDANDPERICGGAQDNSSLARTSSDVWDRQAVTGDGFVCAINPLDASYSYITSYPSGGYPNVWRSTNGLFGSFSDISGSGSGIVNGDRINWVTPYILDPVNPSVLYLGTHRVYRSDNHGTSWTQLGPDLTGGSGSLLTLEVNRTFPAYVFSGSASGRVWHSTNSATDWTEITPGLPARSINDIAADPTNPDRAFAAVGGFNTSHVWEWNAGVGWTEHDGGLPNVPANTMVMLSATDVMVGTDVGVFRSVDGGQTFLPYMYGLPEGLVVTDLKYNALQDVMTAGTYGRGAWQVVVGAAVPILLVDSFEQPLVEMDGDGDVHVEPGETWSVRPILRNAGGEEALGVTARLATMTPGVTLLDEIAAFGDLLPGTTAPAITPLRFVVDPSFVCGDQIVFDVVDITASNSEETFADQPSALVVTVLDEHDTSITTTLMDENFESPPAGWTHEAVDAELSDCGAVVYQDEWNLATRDAEHGTSYHCGNGPGGSVSRSDFSWLYPTGKDSESGPGLPIPNDATAATLTVLHWYDTVEGEDGGQVAIDTVVDGQDVFTALSPVGGYPGGPLTVGLCNGLGGQPAFQGTSGGWVTSTFDLMPYKGGVVYLAFIFGSDKRNSGGEGWYVDEVRLEYQQLGAPVCQVSLWPGVVRTAHFERTDGNTLEAVWDESCNIGAHPTQTYSIQAGDVDALIATGNYTHVPVDDRCDRTSPSTFTPGPGNEYYLVVPCADGREGSAGVDSTGAPRPQVTTTCGEQRPAVCP
jgi:hypothetical protein